MIINPPQSRDEPLLPSTLLQATGDLVTFQTLMGLIDYAHHHPELALVTMRQYCPSRTGVAELPLSMSYESLVALIAEDVLIRELQLIELLRPEGTYSAEMHIMQLKILCVQLHAMHSITSFSLPLEAIR